MGDIILYKRGIRGEGWKVWVVWKCNGERERGRDNVQRVVTGYNRLMSHEHFLEDLLWSFSRECLNIRLSYTHTHKHSSTLEESPFQFPVFFFCFPESCDRGEAALKGSACASINEKWC